MHRFDGKRLRKSAPLLKGEDVVLRLEVHTNAFGGWNAWLWANVPGEGPVVYTGTAKGWLYGENGVPDTEVMVDMVVRRLRELLPFIVV